jgi:hypothetical protein
LEIPSDVGEPILIGGARSVSMDHCIPLLRFTSIATAVVAYELARGGERAHQRFAIWGAQCRVPMQFLTPCTDFRAKRTETSSLARRYSSPTRGN